MIERIFSGSQNQNGLDYGLALLLRQDHALV